MGCSESMIPSTKNCVHGGITVKRLVGRLLATSYLGGPVARTLITIRAKTLYYIYGV